MVKWVKEKIFAVYPRGNWAPFSSNHDLRELPSQLTSSACWPQVVETTDAHGAKPSVPMTTNQLCRQWPYRSLI